MSTKYAKARDVAYQWRSEHRKVQRENRSLRAVYADARRLVSLLESFRLTLPLNDAATYHNAMCNLQESLQKACFAVVPSAAASLGERGKTP